MFPRMFGTKRKLAQRLMPFHVGGPLPPRPVPMPFGGGHVRGPLPPRPVPMPGTGGPSPYGGSPYDAADPMAGGGGGHVGGPLPPQPVPQPGVDPAMGGGGAVNDQLSAELAARQAEMGGADGGAPMPNDPDQIAAQRAAVMAAHQGTPDTAPNSGVSWGGHVFHDPMALFGWEQRHGNRQGFQQFMNQHPAMANQFDAASMRRAAVAAARGRQLGGGPLHAAVARHLIGRMRGRA